VPEESLAEMAQWLEAGHRHFICSTAVQPVARPSSTYEPIDPYLARHFMLSFTPLLCEATEADYLAVSRSGRVTPPQHAWAEAYMKQEKKLHRAYGSLINPKKQPVIPTTQFTPSLICELDHVLKWA
jgi:hypothetical protein